MQDEGTGTPSSIYLQGQLPFHLQPLDFDISTSKLHLLTSEQLALVQFHPDATDTTREKAEILFFKRRERDQHLLERTLDADINAPSAAAIVGGLNATSATSDTAHLKLHVCLACHVGTVASPQDTASSQTHYKAVGISSAIGDGPNQGGNGFQSLNNAEGEATDPGKTPTSTLPTESASLGVKEEHENHGLLMPADSSTGSSRHPSSNATSSKRTSVPLSLNVGTTYGHSSARGTASQRVETFATDPITRRDSTYTGSPSKGLGGIEEKASNASTSSRGRRRDQSARDKEYAVDKRGTERCGKRDRRDGSRRGTSSRPRKSRRRRRRSYTSSSGSSHTSDSYSEGSASTESRGYSSSYMGSRSPSTSPERRRRRHRTSHRLYPAGYVPQYPMVPVPLQMQIQRPMGAMQQQSEEEMSRQQLSHLYRNVPSNPAELHVRASASYASSPPRQARNSFNFPGHPDSGRVPAAYQPTTSVGGTTGNEHPVRAINSRQYPKPSEPSTLSTLQGPSPSARQNTVPLERPNTTLPKRPNATGRPDPLPPVRLRKSDWPAQRTRRRRRPNRQASL